MNAKKLLTFLSTTFYSEHLPSFYEEFQQLFGEPVLEDFRTHTIQCYCTHPNELKQLFIKHGIFKEKTDDTLIFQFNDFIEHVTVEEFAQGFGNLHTSVDYLHEKWLDMKFSSTYFIVTRDKQNYNTLIDCVLNYSNRVR